MRVSHKQAHRGALRYLILPEDEQAARPGMGLIVTLDPPGIRRVKSVPALLRRERWQPLTKNDPTLDDLTARVPALRPFRGIAVRLPGGETAWILWRQWSGGSTARLTAATRSLSVPADEPDADYFLATEAVRLLGGEVLDSPRSCAPTPAEAY